MTAYDVTDGTEHPEADATTAADPTTSVEDVRVGRVGRLIAGTAPRMPGLGLATGIALLATAVGHVLPLLGGPVAGIVIGVALAVLLKPGKLFERGLKTAGTSVLQLSVVVLGSQLSLAQIARVGLESLPVMVGTLAIALLAACLIGRWLGVVGDLRALIGVGTGICGASAIAAVTPVIGALSVDVAYAVSTIFLFNVAAVLTFPLIGHLLGLSQHAFGLFAGTAVNDMSSVVATATTYGSNAANYAVVVKLVRTLMIIPVCLILAAWSARRAEGAPVARPRVRILALIPWFLTAFLIMAAANTIGAIPPGMHARLGSASVFLITVALSAIGLSTNLAGFRRAGARPLLLGAALWITVTLASLGLQFATGLA